MEQQGSHKLPLIHQQKRFYIQPTKICSHEAHHFQRALALELSNLAIFSNAAVLLNILNRTEDTIELLEYYTVADPINSIGHGNLGDSYQITKLWDEMIATLQTALRLSSNYYWSQYFLGYMQLARGNPEPALNALMESHEKKDAYIIAYTQV